MKKTELSSLIGRLTRTGVWEHNYDRNLLEWDKEMFNIYELDYEGSYVDFSAWADMLHPEDAEMVKSLYAEAVENEGEYQITFRIQTPKKNTKYIKASAIEIEKNSSGERIIVGANQDITELILAKVEREELISILNQSQETAKIGSWQHDLVTGKTFNDNATKRIIGLDFDYDLQAEEGISFYKEGYSRNKIMEAFSELIEKGIPYDLELEILTKQGVEIWVRANGKPAYDKQGTIVKVHGVFQDITKQKEKEIELIKRNLDLQTLTERLSLQNEKLNDFAYITSHNLRAPVANLIMLKDLYLEEKDPEELKELLELTGQSTVCLEETLDHLIEALVVQTQVQSTQEWISLRELLANLVNRLGHLIKAADAEIELELEVDVVKAQTLYLDSIFLNLLTNAIKFRQEECKLKISIRSFLKDQELIIEVADNGLGIDLERHANNIFGLHRTFHKNSKARGVGLFMVKTHVEALGGNIIVNSKVNEGTTFILSFNREIAQNDVRE